MPRILPLAVLIFLAATGAGAQEVENPFPDGVDRRAGEASFRVHCSLCHGYDAQGGGETNGPDLTTGRFRRTSTLAGLFNVIRNGVEGTAMLGINPDAPTASSGRSSPTSIRSRRTRRTSTCPATQRPDKLCSPARATARPATW